MKITRLSDGPLIGSESHFPTQAPQRILHAVAGESGTAIAEIDLDHGVFQDLNPACRPNPDQSGRAKATRESPGVVSIMTCPPAATTTYCFPSGRTR